MAASWRRHVKLNLAWYVCAGLLASALSVKGVVTVFENSINRAIFSKVPSENSWSADVSELPSGLYYVSAGRPHGRCQIQAMGEILDANKAAGPELRGDLLLGAGLNLSSSESNRTVTISCDSFSGGLLVGLTHRPVIASYSAGRLLQLWRGFHELLLGPLSSLALLLLLIALPRRRRHSEHSTETSGLSTSLPLDRRDVPVYGIFATVAVSYTLSLAHWFRLFFSELTCLAIHYQLRIAFSLAYIFVLGQMSRHRKVLWILHGMMAVALAGCWAWASETMQRAYSVMFPMFALMCLWGSLDLLRSEAKSVGVTVFKGLAVAWILSQALDTVNVWYPAGSFSAPTFLAMMCGLMGFLRYSEARRADRIHGAVVNLLQSINQRGQQIQDTLLAVAAQLASHSHFCRISAYIDAFVVGQSESRGVRFLRLYESGYDKATKQDWVANRWFERPPGPLFFVGTLKVPSSGPGESVRGA